MRFVSASSRALIAALGLVAVSACSSSGSPAAAPTINPVTAYKLALQRIASEESVAQHKVAAGFHSKTVPELQHALFVFETDQTTAAAEIAALAPPANALAANVALSKAFANSAAAVRSLIRRIEHSKTVKHAFFIIQSDRAAQEVGRQIDAALKRLQYLGYTTGS
jgi:hypothetical protein